MGRIALVTTVAMVSSSVSADSWIRLKGSTLSAKDVLTSHRKLSFRTED